MFPRASLPSTVLAKSLINLTYFARRDTRYQFSDSNEVYTCKGGAAAGFTTIVVSFQWALRARANLVHQGCILCHTCRNSSSTLSQESAGIIVRSSASRRFVVTLDAQLHMARRASAGVTGDVLERGAVGESPDKHTRWELGFGLARANHKASVRG